jgi:hypothetical protein
MTEEKRKMTREERTAAMMAGRKAAFARRIAEQDSPEVQEEAKAQIRNQEERAKAPRERKKWTGFSYRLNFDIPEGYYGYVCNDDPPRKIQELEERGYEFLIKNGIKESRVVGVSSTGQPLTAYCMIQKLEWHEEDEKARAGMADEIDRSILAGNIAGPADGGNAYIPKDSPITLKRN